MVDVAAKSKYAIRFPNRRKMDGPAGANARRDCRCHSGDRRWSADICPPITKTPSRATLLKMKSAGSLNSTIKNLANHVEALRLKRAILRQDPPRSVRREDLEGGRRKEAQLHGDLRVREISVSPLFTALLADLGPSFPPSLPSLCPAVLTFRLQIGLKNYDPQRDKARRAFLIRKSRYTDL